MEENVTIDITDFNEDEKPVIKVIGVGGGGGNAVNYMYEKGIRDVDFVVCNTDNQALKKSPIPYKVLLGDKGLGAGNNPEKGLEEAEKSIDDIRKMLSDSTEMVFVTAGMGGGTGTGAAPLIAKVAKEMGILTVGIVTIPFLFEGTGRVEQALRGVEEMRKSVDSLVVISSERIKEIYSDMTVKNAFHKADDILATAAKGIAEVITRPGYINCDLEDVRTVLTQSGTAIMGSYKASGTDRAITAIQESLNSPLLLTTNLAGSKKILLNISYGKNDILMDEVSIITDHLQKQVDSSTAIIWGLYEDETLADDELSVTIVAAGFPDNQANRIIENVRRPIGPRGIKEEPSDDLIIGQMHGHGRGTVYDGNSVEPIGQQTESTEIDISRYYGKTSVENHGSMGQPSYSSQTVATTQRPGCRCPGNGQLPNELLNLDEDDDDINSITQSYRGASEGVSRFSLRNDSNDMFDDKNGYLNNNVD